MIRTRNIAVAWLLACLWGLAGPFVAVAATPASAPAPPPDFDRAEPLPPGLRGVGVTEHLSTQIPLDLTFTDESGQPVQLAAYFRGDKPVILNLGYYQCPMLCGVVINGLLASLQELSYTPGEQFQVVTVSIDPTEKFPLAAAKKRNVLAELGRPQAAAGWHFLTGDEAAIQRLTEAVGFGYRWDERTKQYAHSAALVVATPDGRVSRYLYGVQYPAKTMRLSLVEASEGKIGSPMDQIILYCFHYDPSRGGYTLAAMNLMRAGGALTVVVLASIIGLSLYRESRCRKREARAV